jgi:hypothetical protein
MEMPNPLMEMPNPTMEMPKSITEMPNPVMEMPKSMMEMPNPTMEMPTPTNFTTHTFDTRRSIFFHFIRFKRTKIEKATIWSPLLLKLFFYFILIINVL